MQPLIRAPDLHALLGNPDLRVFDATFYLPTEPHDARVLFDAGHIPGARFFDLDEVADLDTTLPHMVPTAGRFAEVMSVLGVGRDSLVVFYDQKGLFSAARGWWLMRLFGHERVAVLDGGLPGWLAQGFPVTADPTPAPLPQPYEPQLCARKLRGLGDMRANLASGAELVLDARPAARFHGQAPEPRPGVRPGHIPDAVNLPASSLLAPDQTLLPPEALRAAFAAVGVDGSRPVVTSCGTGVTAAILTLGLQVAGLPEGALYDGSWTEWGSTDLPAAR